MITPLEKYDTSATARVFSLRIKKWLNPRIGKLCNACYPYMRISEVCHRLLTHALDDLESGGDSAEFKEIRTAMLKAKDEVYVHPNTEKINLSLERLERITTP
jgi:hypothetical protein